jgi:hypothetical protein
MQTGLPLQNLAFSLSPEVEHYSFPFMKNLHRDGLINKALMHVRQKAKGKNAVFYSKLPSWGLLPS